MFGSSRKQLETVKRQVLVLEYLRAGAPEDACRILRDAMGKRYQSMADEEIIRAVASQGSGHYLRKDADGNYTTTLREATETALSAMELNVAQLRRKYGV